MGFHCPENPFGLSGRNSVNKDISFDSQSPIALIYLPGILSKPTNLAANLGKESL